METTNANFWVCGTINCWWDNPGIDYSDPNPICAKCGLPLNRELTDEEDAALLELCGEPGADPV